MTIKHLLIDDIRNFHVDKICRTFKEGISALKSEHWNILWLDHDLGDAWNSELNRHMTGYDVICWLEENVEHRPDIIICVSSSPVGKMKIEQAIKKMYGTIFNRRHVDALESVSKNSE